jgi:hypothetical protein
MAKKCIFLLSSEIVRKDMDINEHEILSDYYTYSKIQVKEQRVYCISQS